MSILQDLRSFYAPINKARKVPVGSPPRKTISDALKKSFYVILETIKPDLVMEIGAHEASFSIEMKNRLPGAEILAFEANPHVYEKYSQTILENKIDIRYLWRAVSDADGDIDLFIPTSIRGRSKPLGNRIASLNQLKSRDVEGTNVRVPASRLDSIMADHADKSSAIWIDVEGAVDRVIAGAHATLRNAQAIMCEVESKSIWQDQMQDTQIIEKFEAFDLHPILCDCQSIRQYNIILIKANHLANPGILEAMTAFKNEVETILNIAP